MVDVSIVDDGRHERLNGAGLLRVQTEIVDKVWREVENSPGFPRGHFIAKSALGRRGPATVRRRGPWDRGAMGARVHPLTKENNVWVRYRLW